MSEERWEELGLSRGRFLKRLAAGAFVAPVIVSFGLEGVAEAANQSVANQAYQHAANQAHFK